MRDSDRAKLEEAYPSDQHPELRFAEALGVAVPEVMELYGEILADFDANRFGVGWWHPHPGTSRRILISDHLLLCAWTIQTNLVESQLHLLELMDVWQTTSEFFTDVVQVRRGQLVLTPPPRVRPRDDLPLRLSALHGSGFFRALVGALDCLGAAIVGVAALPTGILKADLYSALAAFPKKPSNEGELLQDKLHETLEQSIRGAGPAGWLDWAINFRNMLVHRGRRAEAWQIIPRPSPIVDFRGRPIVRAETTQQLPRDPGRSEIEVLLRGRELVLSETARVTLQGTMASTIRVVVSTAAELLSLWRRRRTEPNLLHQPRSQWKKGASPVTTGFMGYEPGSLPYDPGLLMASPSFRTRLLAAALDDAHRELWAGFD